jgi:vesicle coat complex subunit
MYSARRLVLFIALLAGGCGKESTDQLIDNLKAPEAATRIRAARTLPERKADVAQVVPALVEALQDDHTDVRRCAAHGLGSFGAEAKAAVPALQSSLRDREPSVRKAVSNALSQIDPTRFPDSSKATREQAK